VAYRRLCAVTFAVLGWVTVGCGSGSGPDASTDAIDEHPPGNREQPTNNATDPAPRSEQAPINPDQPPDSADGLPSQGGGGEVEGQCRAFCDSIEGKDCTGAGNLTAAIREVCQSGCVLSTQDRLCVSEIAGVVGCLNSLSGLCTDAFDEDQSGACDVSFRAFNACEEANEPDDTQGACNIAGGCECETACQTCGCFAGNNAQALAACVTGACAQ
jgi:hypothetical protein